MEQAEETKKLKGVGGWLIFPVLGLFLSLYYYGATLLGDIQLLTAPNAWRRLTIPGTPEYYANLAPMAVFEAVSAVGFIAASIILLVMLFKCKKELPKWMVRFYIAEIVLAVVQYYSVSKYYSYLPAGMAADPLREQLYLLIGTTGRSVIWAWYFRASIRVKNTFVE